MSDGSVDEGMVVAPINVMGKPKGGFFARLTKGLSKTSQAMTEQVVSVLTKSKLDQDMLDRLEETLIEADLGADTSAKITEAFGRGRFGRELGEDEIKEALAELVAKEIIHREGAFKPLGGPKPYVVLFVGVNGAGKTTTLGKIASDLKNQGAKVLIGAGDTFRAAAIEQLTIWAERAGVPIISKPHGSDAAALAYEAVEKARREGFDVVLIDTAGRLQTKAGLMDELKKIVRVLKKMDERLPHEILLVLDATVGRNALSQVEAFDRTSGVTGLVMTKLDGTARGGILVPVAKASAAPIKLIGVGEGIDDLQAFDAKAFARSLVGLEQK